MRSTPRATYEALRRALSKADNLEEGHYMERSWSSVLSGGAVTVERSRLVVYTVEGGGGGGRSGRGAVQPVGDGEDG